MTTKPAPAQHTPQGHTPGPWDAHDDDGTGTLPCVLSAHVNAGGNFYVVQCQNFVDARLIAAAPALLEACKEAREALRLSAPLRKGDGPKLCHAFISVATAITQAGGKP